MNEEGLRAVEPMTEVHRKQGGCGDKASCLYLLGSLNVYLYKSDAMSIIVFQQPLPKLAVYSRLAGR